MLTLRTDIRSEQVERMLRAAGPRAAVGIARALNRAGGPTKTAHLRAAKKTLGLRSHPYAKPLGDYIKRHTSTKRANASRLTYSLAGFGQGLPAIYYQPKETPRGASIVWLGQRRMIDRSFYLSGRFPRRKRSKISHAVWRRLGKGKWNLDRPRGPSLPDAMVEPGPAAAWNGNAQARLAPALIKELGAILAGHA